ncbi:uncharacterized protein LOC105253878 [Camponotus floridanus]|uniref:uncharacterized protein LOC105253878 n=1 Tax=Camponotus floridanus TaxID=104421 RepID=UPI00059CFCF4|nr:uncharacterized protein LOC105253878 [Camponotus floridanus]
MPEHMPPWPRLAFLAPGSSFGHTKNVRDCLTCFKARLIQSEALMDSLPINRVTVSRPFSHCGVDYAGPIILREDKRRNHKAGIQHFLREHETTWCFIPPNAPHFNGLWEVAVKSAKYHMARIIGKAHLTFEEMSTVLCEVEAILNSRSLTQLRADPNDLVYLSPGHFLISTTLNGFSCHDLHDVNENRLTRWQRVEQIRQHFWRRWSLEYLHSLQERTKWKVNKGVQLKPEQLVLIKQQGLPPLQWLLGRIQEVHTGADCVARAATVRTAKGSFMKPLSKLAILPIDLSIK